MRSGFTLVEMLVVLLILGVMAAAAAPALRDPEESDERHAAEEVVRMLRASRGEALRRAERITLNVEWTTGRYSIGAESRIDALREGRFQLPPGARVESLSPRARFLFSPDGTASGPAVTIHVGGRAVRIEIDQWLGDVRVATR